MRSAVGYIRVSKPKQSRSGLGLEARQAKYLKVPINLCGHLRASLIGPAVAHSISVS